MFNAAFKALGCNAFYTRISAGSAREGLQIARDIGMTGLNVTTPFKESVLEELDEMDAGAGKIEAVNTIVRRHNGWVGANSDHVGVVRALENNGVSIKGRKAVVLGAGGAGRAAVYGLIQAGAIDVVLANRTLEKARTAADRLGCRWCRLKSLERELSDAHILVSCISGDVEAIGLKGFHEKLVLLRADYRISRDSPESRGAVLVINGLEWLLYQAEPAFKLFVGKEAPLNVMKAGLAKDGLEAIKKRNVAVIGFMGAGKSLVGQKLASSLGMDFEDTDVTIETHAGKSILEIFRDSGEEAFRRMEKTVLEQVNGANRKIFSCGGGVVLNARNREILLKNCVTVWLWASLPTILGRVIGNARPLLSGNDSTAEAAQLLAHRMPWYTRAADLIVANDGTSPETVVERIKNEMSVLFNG